MRIEYIVTAKTVDEAYKKAVEIYSSMGEISLEEVINPGKKGFLGLFGAIPAEIRISVDDGREERKPKQKQDSISVLNHRLVTSWIPMTAIILLLMSLQQRL